MSIFEMTSQVEKITFERAAIVYGLGFPIQVEVVDNNIKKSILIEENTGEQRTFEAELIRLNLMDSDGKYYNPVKFYMDLEIAGHAGLHVEYDDGKPNSIEFGTFDWVLQTLLSMRKEYDIETYVKNHILYATAKRRKEVE